MCIDDRASRLAGLEAQKGAEGHGSAEKATLRLVMSPTSKVSQRVVCCEPKPVNDYICS